MGSVIKEWKEGAKTIQEVTSSVTWEDVLACEGDSKDMELTASMIEAKGCEGKQEALLARVARSLGVCPVESVAAAAALHKHLDSTQKGALIENVLENVAVQNLDQVSRIATYTMIKTHVETEDVPRTAAFVNSFIRAIDGERDPRCLLLTFAMHSKVTAKLGREGIGSEDPSLLEEMFDVVSCYFPISYTAPKKEKNPVSTDDLKQGVLNCCTHSCYSDFAIPFALDKLSSPLGDTKQDALQMICECCANYGTGGEMLIEPYFSELWTQIRTETLNGSIRGDELLMRKLFETVTCIAKVISQFDSQNLMHAHLKVLFDGVLNMASVPQGFVNAKSYSALVHFAASASLTILDTVLTRLIPVLHSAFIENPDNVNRRVSILGIYNGVLGAAIKLNASIQNTEMEDAVFTLADKGTTTEGMVLCAEACSSIMQFGSSSSSRAASTLVKILLDMTDNEARVMVIRALQTAVPKTEALVADTVIPNLLAASDFDADRAVSALLAITDTEQTLMHVVSRALLMLVGKPQHSALCITVLDKLAEDKMKQKPIMPSAILSADAVSNAVAAGCVSKGLQLAFALLGDKDQETVLSACSDKAKWYPLVCGVRCGVSVDLDIAVTPEMSEGQVLAVASVVNKTGAAMPEGYATTPHVGLLLKAGLMRGDEGCMQTLLDIVGSRADAAGVLSTIFTDIPSLSAVMGHVHKFLWVQKVYSKVLPVLLGKYKSEADERKKCEVFESVAVAVAHAPAALVSSDAERLLPVVTGGLASSNGAIVTSSLDILHSLVQQDPSSVAKVPLLTLIVPSLLQATTYKPARKTRVTALNILNLLATDKNVAHAAVVFKQQVINGLLPALDDHKRVVRAAATQARCSWYLLA
eukprot:TRINITY_DN5194_c0_g1_i1.p1 TRINITY_DN5194_c0_g1~~TRINITY_DN5194_c0_g1_i1.p1  ORF type:complete len:871 (+),score=300.64 TRINITY_DN5194_c0_g1_i1:45-2657(+)